MNRKFACVLLISLFSAVSVFAQFDLPELGLEMPQFNSVSYFAAAVTDEEDPAIINSIRNNEFYLESVRLTKLAQDTYEFGDYDASAGFAEEAIRYAQLSDEYVADQLIGEAGRLLSWADSNNIASLHPNDYNEGKNYYEASVAAHSNEEWDEAIAKATNAIIIFAAFETGGSVAPLPRQYTVRTWAAVRDCLWNIAGYSWVYGESGKWRVLYDANKSKLPDPSNPNLIEPGTVLEIPSISGEIRQGIWDSNKTYKKP